MGKFMSPLERQCDLMRQGFMRPGAKKQKPKTEKPMRACDKCQDWHRGTCTTFQALKASRAAMLTTSG